MKTSRKELLINIMKTEQKLHQQRRELLVLKFDLRRKLNDYRYWLLAPLAAACLWGFKKGNKFSQIGQYVLNAVFWELFAYAERQIFPLKKH